MLVEVGGSKLCDLILY